MGDLIPKPWWWIRSWYNSLGLVGLFLQGMILRCGQTSFQKKNDTTSGFRFAIRDFSQKNQEQWHQIYFSYQKFTSSSQWSSNGRNQTYHFPGLEPQTESLLTEISAFPSSSHWHVDGYHHAEAPHERPTFFGISTSQVTRWATKKAVGREPINLFLMAQMTEMEFSIWKIFAASN